MTGPDGAAVAHVAGLARLRFTDPELAQLQQEFAAILEMVQVLDELPSAPAADDGGDAPIPMRADATTNPSQPEAMLRNAPDREGSCFRVPVVLGAED